MWGSKEEEDRRFDTFELIQAFSTSLNHCSRRSFGRTARILYCHNPASHAVASHYSGEVIHHRVLPHHTPRDTDNMSSYYSSPPTSLSSGFFPAGPASPHAFASFHQSPRDSHSMYAAFGSSHSSGHAAPMPRQASRGSGNNALKRLVGRN